MAGVESTGFDKKLVSEILAELDASLKASIDPTLNTDPTSIMGQILGVFSGGLSEAWDVLEAVYLAQYPDSANGAALDAVAALTGAIRLAATKSTVELIATGDDATALPIGRQASVPSSGAVFETTAAAVLDAAESPQWVTATPYALGDLVHNESAGQDRVYVCILAGTSGALAPIGTGTATDGAVIWRYVGDGDSAARIPAEAVNTGPIVGQAFTITTIDTPVSGWGGVSNDLDAEKGTNLETDAAFRLRREQLISTAARGTVEAIRARVLSVSGVVSANVFENTSLFTNSDGVPGKAFETVVVGGDDADIAQAIFDSKPAGIEAYGNDISEAIVDSQGESHTIQASRAIEVDMYATITITKDGNFPADGVARVKQAIIDSGSDLGLGGDVIFARVLCAPLDVPGVVDVTALLLDRLPASTTTANAETYALVNGQTLFVNVDGQEVDQTVTFSTGDFVDISLATAAEVAAVLDANLSNAGASAAGGFVTITSDAGGTIKVTGGTANGALGFPTSFSPSGTVNVPIGSRELSRWLSSNLSVIS
jgi:uncharacterized phage protein gp47/JayE